MNPRVAPCPLLLGLAATAASATPVAAPAPEAVPATTASLAEGWFAADPGRGIAREKADPPADGAGFAVRDPVGTAGEEPWSVTAGVEEILGRDALRFSAREDIYRQPRPARRYARAPREA